MRRSAIIAAAATFAFAWTMPAAGGEQVYYTITLQEARLANAGPAPAYVGRNDGRLQSFEIADWGFGAVAKIDGFTVKQKVKPVGTSDLTLKRGTSATGENVQSSQDIVITGSRIPQPNSAGTLRVKVRFPWLACEEGKFYPQLVMGSPVKTTYILHDATVTGCSRDGATFSYSKVEFERVKPH